MVISLPSLSKQIGPLQALRSETRVCRGAVLSTHLLFLPSTLWVCTSLLMPSLILLPRKPLRILPMCLALRSLSRLCPLKKCIGQAPLHLGPSTLFCKSQNLFCSSVMGGLSLYIQNPVLPSVMSAGHEALFRGPVLGAKSLL